jgi:hypothetical protein
VVHRKKKEVILLLHKTTVILYWFNHSPQAHNIKAISGWGAVVIPDRTNP